jgi:glycosyltransferase involved in cell wall biosynthesis
MNPELLIVMPVYNEQASVRKVVLEWFHELQNWTENFTILAINDGSQDDSLLILRRLAEQLGSCLQIMDQANKGHGQSCLVGYREACRRQIPYVFQIDSDGQCDPQYFFRFWRDRESYDVIYGQRVKREDGWRRVLASYALRSTLLWIAQANCIDANVPYRLMRTAQLLPVLDKIPGDFHLANVALAVLLRRDASWRQASVPIRFRERYGGEPSVRLGKFGEKARELHMQMRQLLSNQ